MAAGDGGTTAAGGQASGEWRTVRSPAAPPEVGQAMGVLLQHAADHARAGDGMVAVKLRRALDTLRDFVLYEPPAARSTEEVEASLAAARDCDPQRCSDACNVLGCWYDRSPDGSAPAARQDAP